MNAEHIPHTLEPRRRRRWKRVVFGCVAVMALLVVGTTWFVTSSAFLVKRVTPELSRKLGGPTTIERAEYLGEGRFRFHDLRLRTDAIPGEGGDIASIREATVDVNMGLLFRGKVHLQNVQLTGVRIRISEDREQPGQVNVMTLAPVFSTSDEQRAPPQLSVTDATIEFGQHFDSSFELSQAREVTGTFLPSTTQENTYNFALRELAASIDDDVQPLKVEGVWDVAGSGLTSEVVNVQLDERMYRACPQQVQLWWDRMQLEGAVSIDVGWTRTTPLTVELALLDTAISIPLEIEGFWGRFVDGESVPSAGAPRMKVDQGRILLSRERLQFTDVRGTIIGSDVDDSYADVPYLINGTLYDLPPLVWSEREDWTSDALESCPFDVEVTTDEFRFNPSDDGHAGIELPQLVTRVLARFKLEQWSLSTSFRVWRDRSDDGTATVQTKGAAFVKEASGQFDQFAYPLTELSAFLEWDENQLTIHEVTARGEADSVLKASGRVAPLRGAPAVTMRVKATDLPVDDVLRDALSEGRRGILEDLVNRNAAASLDLAGLWPETADGASPWHLAGNLDLDLMLERAAGDAQPLVMTGTIELPWFGMLYERFPYPFWIRDGVLHFLEDKIVLGTPGEGIKIETATGGSGRVHGEVRLSSNGVRGKTVPDIRFDLSGDQSSILLEAALPLGSTERAAADEQGLVWPGGVFSGSADLIRRIGLAGELRYSGTLGVDETIDRAVYEVEVALDNGRAVPRTQPGPVVSPSPVQWPTDLELDDVRGSIFVSQRGVRIEGLRGQLGDGDVIASGNISFGITPRETTVSVTFDDTPIDEYLIDLAPAGGQPRLRELFDMFEPTGGYDAEYTYESIAGERNSELVFAPSTLHLAVDDRTVTLERSDGRLRLLPNGVAFESLALGVSSGEITSGDLRVDGRFVMADSGEVLTLQGDWTDGRLESPLVSAVLKLIKKDALQNWYAAGAPAGIGDVAFRYRDAGPHEPIDFMIDYQPRILSTNLRGRRLRFNVDDGGRVMITPGLVEFDQMAGAMDAGEYEISGEIELGEITRGDLSIGFAGDLREERAQALLPDAVNQVLETIEFQDNGPSRLRDTRLRFLVRDLEEQPIVDRIDVDTSLELSNASFRTGVQFTEVEGRFDFDVAHRHGQSPSVDVDIAASSLRALDQHLTRAVGQLTRPHDSDVITLRRMTANMHGGVMWAEGESEIGNGGAYEFRVEIIGAALEGIFADATRTTPSETSAGEAQPQGQVYSDIELGGRIGQLDGRRGRGVLRIVGGRVADVPLALQLAHLFQFTVPTDGALDYAEVDFFIDGGTMVMERILLESSSGTNALMQVFGDGHLELDSFEFRAWLRTRSGLAIIRDIVGGISDSFFQIEVTGTLREPKARLVPKSQRAPRVRRPGTVISLGESDEQP